jgi:hypothetical protein
MHINDTASNFSSLLNDTPASIKPYSTFVVEGTNFTLINASAATNALSNVTANHRNITLIAKKRSAELLSLLQSSHRYYNNQTVNLTHKRLID